MKDKKSLYVASALCSALCIATTSHALAEGSYDPQKKHCYGAALKGQNDCGDKAAHSCKGTATVNCSPKDWKLVLAKEDCELLISYCKLIDEAQNK